MNLNHTSGAQRQIRRPSDASKSGKRWRTGFAGLLLAVSLDASNATEIPAPRVDPLTQVEVDLPDGGPFDIATLRGHPAAIYVWGEWCRACQRSTPAMLELARQHPDVPVVLINTDAPARRLRVTSTDLPANVIETRVSESYFDGESRRKKRFVFSQLGLVFGIPAYFLLDANGRIAAQGNGSRYPERLAEALDALRQEATNRTNGAR